jgi:colanic acid biosynthesis glycosyl transferase WcaI
MQRILLISYNFSPELTGIGKYNGEMIDWLVNKGYECSVLTAYPYYPNWKIQNNYSRNRFRFSTEYKQTIDSKEHLTIYRCPIYVPKKPSGTSRVLLEMSFCLTAFIRLVTLLTTKKFDLVIAVAPSFQVGLLGMFYKLIRRAKLMYHIQDLQIEAARDLKMIKSQSIINVMLQVEKQILKRADLVSSISDEMVGKVTNKGGRKAFLFPNWTNTTTFFPISDRARLKTEFGFNPSDKVVMYSGAIGEKQGLESILKAALATKDKQEVKFIICGNGPYKEELQKTSTNLNLTNVYFFPLQPLDRFNEFLNLADIHLIIQKSSASDLVMPSKLGAILAVGGLTLITANPGTSLYTLVKRHNIGVTVNADDQAALNNGLTNLLNGDFQNVARNARTYAIEFLSIDRVMSRFELTFQEALTEANTNAIIYNDKVVN